MIRNILLPIDGSASAQRAVDYAASLALRFRAKVIVLNAFLLASAPNGEAYTKVSHAPLEDSRMLLAQAVQRLRDMGVTGVDATMMEGPPTNVILGVAETCQPDLIVIGARGSGTWPGHILGSVSMAVTQRADCPVLVVR